MINPKYFKKIVKPCLYILTEFERATQLKIFEFEKTQMKSRELCAETPKPFLFIVWRQKNTNFGINYACKETTDLLFVSVM